MLSYLLEKFVRRLCGRWLRNFSAENLSVSLGGTVSFDDLWLNTSELNKMMLPFEPVAAHAARLRLELPLNLSGAVTLTIDDVDIYLRSADYDVDGEAARRAVEIAVNLYWANYLRPPQEAAKKKGDAAKAEPEGEHQSATALSDTISSIVKSSVLVIRRVHVRVESPRPGSELGDGRGEKLLSGCVIHKLTVDGASPAAAAENVVAKKIRFTGVACYCGAGDGASGCDEADAGERKQRDARVVAALRGAWPRAALTDGAGDATFGDMIYGVDDAAAKRKALELARTAGALSRAAAEAAVRGRGATVLSFDEALFDTTLSLDLGAALKQQTPPVGSDGGAVAGDGDELRPWIKNADVAADVTRLRGRLTPLALAFLLDAAERLARAHRRRQDVARRTPPALVDARPGGAPPAPRSPGDLLAGHFDSDDDDDDDAFDEDPRGARVPDSAAKSPERPMDPTAVADELARLKRRIELVKQQTAQRAATPAAAARALERVRARWAAAIGAARADVAKRRRDARDLAAPRPGRADAATWRAWFDEWRGAARYVAIRKLLHKHVRCGVFRDESSGEAYYELGESSCVTRAGKFYVHPCQLARDEVGRARRAVDQQVRPRRYRPPFPPRAAAPAPGASAPTPWASLRDAPPGSTLDFEVDDWEIDGEERDDDAPGDIDPRLALALYAEQLALDATWPAVRAAACRAIAHRHATAAKLALAEQRGPGDAPTLLVQLDAVDGVPAASTFDAGVGRERDVRVDLRLLAPDFAGEAPAFDAAAGAECARSPPSALRGATATWDDAAEGKSWHELRPKNSAAPTLALSLVEVGVAGTYETRLGTVLVPFASLEPPRTRKDTAVRELNVFLDAKDAPEASSWFGRKAAGPKTKVSFVVALARSSTDVPKARKALAGFLDGRAKARRAAAREPAGTTVRASLDASDVELRVDIDGEAAPLYEFVAATVRAAASPVAVPGSRVHAPGGSGEGSVLAALYRVARALLAPGAGAPGSPVLEATQATFVSSTGGSRARPRKKTLLFKRAPEPEPSWFKPSAGGVVLVAPDGALVRCHAHATDRYPAGAAPPLAALLARPSLAAPPADRGARKRFLDAASSPYLSAGACLDVDGQRLALAVPTPTPLSPHLRLPRYALVAKPADKCARSGAALVPVFQVAPPPASPPPTPKKAPEPATPATPAAPPPPAFADPAAPPPPPPSPKPASPPKAPPSKPASPPVVTPDNVAAPASPSPPRAAAAPERPASPASPLPAAPPPTFADFVSSQGEPEPPKPAAKAKSPKSPRKIPSFAKKASKKKEPPEPAVVAVAADDPFEDPPPNNCLNSLAKCAIM